VTTLPLRRWIDRKISMIEHAGIAGAISGFNSKPTSEQHWRFPSRVPSLQHDRLHIWRIPLGDSRMDRGANWLSAGELEQAASYRPGQDRMRFIRRRAALRQLLAAYVNCSAKKIAFSRGKWGKLGLLGAPDVQFSVSQSGDWALIALTRCVSIGLDVEQVRELADLDEIAAVVLGPRETLALSSMPKKERTRAFYQSWIRKEAYVKMLGLGLFKELRSIDIERLGDELVAIREHDRCAAHFLAEVVPANHFVAAVIAAEAGPFSYDLFDALKLDCT
jgi:4'-phosphopantetheinyl transferase